MKLIAVLSAAVLISAGAVATVMTSAEARADEKRKAGETLVRIINDERNRQQQTDGITMLPDKNSTVNTQVGGKFRYTGQVQLSVGSWYDVEYDKNAFKLESNVVYDDPESAENECGGDSADKVCTFTALKRGTYTIKVLYDFRGDIERTVTYKVVVK